MLTVLILAYNEEANISYALESVCGWASQVFVVDSFSTDRTVQIAQSFPCEVVRHRFVDYSTQRNFALQLPISAGWVMFVDADETVPKQLRDEISSLITSSPLENGFFVKWRMIFMERWIRRGYYPTWILRLFRTGTARCESRGINEHLIVDGKVGYLHNDLIHQDRKPLQEWIAKQAEYARREALMSFQRQPDAGEIAPSLLGSQAERKRWVRIHVWNRLPPLVRPFLYFGYRYVVRGGFLDGKEAFIFHFLQALWLQILISVNQLQTQQAVQRGAGAVKGRKESDSVTAIA